MTRIALLSAALLAASAAIAPAQTVSIGTTPAGTLNNSMGVAVGTVLHRATGVQTRVTPYSGTEQFIPLVDSGELELAFPSSTEAFFAMRGQEVYKGRKNPNLRAVATLFDIYFSIMVPEKSGIRTVGSLADGKHAVATGYTNHAQAHRYFHGILAGHNVDPAKLKSIAVPHVIDGVKNLMQGKVAATMFAVGVPKNAEIQSKIGPIRFLNVNNSADGIARLRKFVPTADVIQLKPAKQRIGVPEPTWLLAESYVLVAGARVADKIAYDVAKLMHRNKDELVKILPIFRQYRPETLARDQGVPFHPGAEKYYREAGVWKR